MADAVRDAKLRLNLDTVEAVRGMEEVVRAGEKVERQQERIGEAAASSTQKVRSATDQVIERYGEQDLSTPETAVSPRAMRRIERQHDSAQRALEEYRLKKHYATLRAQRAAASSGGEGDGNESPFAFDTQGGRSPGGESGSGLGSLAGAMRYGPQAVMASAAMIAFVKSVESTTQAINTLRNSDLTEAQKVNALADQATFGLWGKFKELGNAIDGTTEAIRRSNIRLQQDSQFRSSMMSSLQETHGLDVSAGDARNRANVMAGAYAPGLAQFDRSTMAGEIGFQEEQQRFGARDSAASAERDAEVARRNLSDAQRRSGDADSAYKSARRNRLEVQGRYDSVMAGERGGERNAGGRATIGAELADAQGSEEAIFERRIQIRRELGQASVAAAEAESRARQANIAVMQTELQILQQREQRLTADASRLGGMNFLDRRLGSAAARMVQDQGIQNVSPEILAQARAYAPDFIAQQQRQFGETTPEFAEDRRRGILTPGSQSINEIRGQTAETQQGIRDAMIADQQQTAKKIADSSQETFDTIARIFDAFNERLEQLERRLNLKLQIGNNSQN